MQGRGGPVHTSRGPRLPLDRKERRCLSHERQQNHERKAVPHSLTCVAADGVDGGGKYDPPAAVGCRGLECVVCTDHIALETATTPNTLNPRWLGLIYGKRL